MSSKARVAAERRGERGTEMCRITRLLGLVVSCAFFLTCGCGDDDGAHDAPCRDCIYNLTLAYPPAFDLSGTWDIYSTPTDGSEIYEGPVTITQTGPQLVLYSGGTVIGWGIILEDIVTLAIPVPNDVTMVDARTTSATHIEGTYNARIDGTWRAERL
jgi:hypothetical protein